MVRLSVIPDPDLDPREAVARALQDLQPALDTRHVQAVSVDPPLEDIEEPVWRWSLVDGAHLVQDRQVTVYPGGTSHPEIRSGIVMQVRGDWMVVATDSEDETADELAEQALCHLACIRGE